MRITHAALLALILTTCAFAPSAWSQEMEEGGATAEAPRSSIREMAERFRVRVGGSMALTWTTTQPRSANANPVLSNRDANPEEGFMGEFALGATIDPTPKTRGTLRVCYGCHQLELESAYFSIEVAEHLSLRAGRFALPLGGVNSRHDQSVRIAPSKPLIQAMGNMVRGREFNQGIIPAPMVDNGIAVSGSVMFGGLKLAGELFLVSGPKGFGPDFDFISSRNFADNNREPSGGARLELSGDRFSVGATYMGGNYNRDGTLQFHILTADFSANLGSLKLEGMYAQRRTQYDDAGTTSAFWKRGYWVQAAWLIQEGVWVFAAADGLFVSDIYLSGFGPTANPAAAITDRSNQVHRLSSGLSWAVMEGVTAKGSVEFYDFSDFRDAIAAQFALSWTF